MAFIKVVNAIACEHVAQGAHRKHVIVNAFAGDIVVKELPALFPVAFYFEVLLDVKEKTKITFELQVDRKGLGGIQVEVEPSSDGLPGLGVVTLPAFSIAFQKAGELRVVAKAHGHKNAVVFSKTVDVGAIPED